MTFGTAQADTRLQICRLVSAYAVLKFPFRMYDYCVRENKTCSDGCPLDGYTFSKKQHFSWRGSFVLAEFFLFLSNVIVTAECFHGDGILLEFLICTKCQDLDSLT